MDKTKKYTLIFVVICFLLIGGVGVYHVLTPSQPTQDQNQTLVDNDTETTKDEEQTTKKETSETKKESEQDKSSTTDSQKKETKTSSDSSKTNQKNNETQTTSKEETSKPTEEPTVEMVQVQLVITGLDSTITNSEVEVEKGKSVFDVLKKLTSDKGIELKVSGSGSMIYIRGIQGLNEFDHGPMSGWKYKVNGNYPSQSAGGYLVEKGDYIEWIYTTNG